MRIPTPIRIAREGAKQDVQNAERTYQLYTEYAPPDANIIGWLTSARHSLEREHFTAARATAEQIRAEVYRLSIANGLITARN